MANDGARSFCEAIDPSPRLAVLGIFSSESHYDLRMAIRQTWLHGGNSDTDGGILGRFVVRGLGASVRTLDEAALHSDTVFLRADAALNRRAGPLASLMLWFDCALKAWPRALLVGNALSFRVARSAPALSTCTCHYATLVLMDTRCHLIPTATRGKL